VPAALVIAPAPSIRATRGEFPDCPPSPATPMPAPLREVVAHALEIDPARVTDDLDFDSAPEWDSVKHITLILALESEYGVAISDDEVVELTSYPAIRDLIRSQVPQAVG
jgi:acyl carrier protein